MFLFLYSGTRALNYLVIHRCFFFIFLLRNKESVTETSVSFSVLWHSCTESFGCTRCLFFSFFVFAQQRICKAGPVFFFVSRRPRTGKAMRAGGKQNKNAKKNKIDHSGTTNNY